MLPLWLGANPNRAIHRSLERHVGREVIPHGALCEAMRERTAPMTGWIVPIRPPGSETIWGTVELLNTWARFGPDCDETAELCRSIARRVAVKAGRHPQVGHSEAPGTGPQVSGPLPAPVPDCRRQSTKELLERPGRRFLAGGGSGSPEAQDASHSHHVIGSRSRCGTRSSSSSTAPYRSGRGSR